MRIIIEVDERAGATVQTVPELSPMEAQDAGAPSEELLRLVQAETRELTAVPGAADVVDAGSPPQWLQEAIAAATSTEVETTAAEGGEGGAAPAIEE